MKASIFSILFVFFIGASSYRVTLPPGKTAESVVYIGGSNFLLSDVITGNVMLMDIQTRRVVTVVQAPANRSIQGIAYDKKSNLVFAAGSGNPFATILNGILDAAPNPNNLNFKAVNAGIYLYDLSTGAEYTSCSVPGSVVINDVAIDHIGRYAYFTESLKPFLYRMKIDALPRCEIDSIPLPTAEFSGELFYASGIARFRGGMIVTNFNPGTIYFVDLVNGKVSKVVDGDYGGMDGITTVAGRCLLAASNNAKTIIVFRLTFNSRTRKLTVKFARRITSPDFTELTSLAVRGRTVVATNNDIDVLGNGGTLWATVERIPQPANLC